MTYLLLTLALASCGSGDDNKRASGEYLRVIDTPSSGWQRAAIFEIESRDTTKLYDISLLLRCRASQSSERSIALNVTTTTPTQLRVNERISIDTEVPAERDIKLIEVSYRSRVRWSECGEYQIAIFPTKPTDGVESVGVIVNESSTNDRGRIDGKR